MLSWRRAADVPLLVRLSLYLLILLFLVSFQSFASNIKPVWKAPTDNKYFLSCVHLDLVKPWFSLSLVQLWRVTPGQNIFKHLLFAHFQLPISLTCGVSTKSATKTHKKLLYFLLWRNVIVHQQNPLVLHVLMHGLCKALVTLWAAFMWPHKH